jgi:hypothetical protein
MFLSAFNIASLARPCLRGFNLMLENVLSFFLCSWHSDFQALFSEGLICNLYYSVGRSLATSDGAAVAVKNLDKFSLLWVEGVLPTGLQQLNERLGIGLISSNPGHL